MPAEKYFMKKDFKTCTVCTSFLDGLEQDHFLTSLRFFAKKIFPGCRRAPLALPKHSNQETPNMNQMYQQIYIKRHR